MYSILIWIGCIIGSLSVLPFMQNTSILMGGIFPHELTLSLIFLMALEGMICFGILIFFGRKFAQKIGIKFLFLDKNTTVMNSLIKPGLLVGMLCTFLQVTVDKLLPTAQFSLHYLTINTPPLYGLIGSIYGAFNEEVFMQLFFLSAIAVLLTKMFKQVHKNTIMWNAIIITSLVFGLCHLPNFVHAITPDTPLIVLRVLLLNSISGVLFGYVFWRKGFEVAMLAHLINDIGLYFFIPIVYKIIG